MSGQWLFALEVFVVLGAAFGFGVWQLIQLNRLKREREADAARKAEPRDAGTAG